MRAKELEQFASRNDTLLRNYISKCEEAGREYLYTNHCLNQWDIPSKLSYLTEAGEKELGELLGFKRYLTDLPHTTQRSAEEIPVRKELLSYAMLFGIADQLAGQMKALYPEGTVKTQGYPQCIVTANAYYRLMFANMHQAEQQREQEKSSEGSGGYSSLGGGGGSIGGGSGGGTR